MRKITKYQKLDKNIGPNRPEYIVYDWTHATNLIIQMYVNVYIWWKFENILS